MHSSYSQPTFSTQVRHMNHNQQNVHYPHPHGNQDKRFSWSHTDRASPRSVGNGDVKARHDFYMLQFRTEYCPDFPAYQCDKAKPYTCPMAHYENHLRRKPIISDTLGGHVFLYSSNLCSIPSLLDCPEGQSCSLSHRVQKEHIYHPSVYKTQTCDSPLNTRGECADYGQHCSKAHGDHDLRKPVYDANLLMNEAVSRHQHPQRVVPSPVAKRLPSPHMRRALSPQHQQQADRRNPSPVHSMRRMSPVNNRGSPFSPHRTSPHPQNGRAISPQRGGPPIQEKPAHRKYLFTFRTQTCRAFMEGKCPLDSYTCFDAHSRLPKRRRPQLINGRFNYIPTKCRYIQSELECPQGQNCRYAHGSEEVIYHPSKYKTQLCNHVLDNNGHCTGFGLHCAKAHGEDDVRVAVFEDADESSTHRTHSPMTTHTFDDLYQYICQESEKQSERTFYMYFYKTRQCHGFPNNCECNGFDWHRAEERRRGPTIRYSPMACPNVKPYAHAEWGDPEQCPKGNSCEYAHTLLELMYHPQVYKTGLCDHFDEKNPQKWRCVWKRRCAHAHGRADLRSKEQALEEWGRHMQMRSALSRPQLPAHAMQVNDFPAARGISPSRDVISPFSNHSNNTFSPHSHAHPSPRNALSPVQRSVISPLSADYHSPPSLPRQTQSHELPQFVPLPFSSNDSTRGVSSPSSETRKRVPLDVVNMLLGPSKAKGPSSQRSRMRPPQLHIAGSDRAHGPIAIPRSESQKLKWPESGNSVISPTIGSQIGADTGSARLVPWSGTNNDGWGKPWPVDDHKSSRPSQISPDMQRSPLGELDGRFGLWAGPRQTTNRRGSNASSSGSRGPHSNPTSPTAEELASYQTDTVISPQGGPRQLISPHSASFPDIGMGPSTLMSSDDPVFTSQESKRGLCSPPRQHNRWSEKLATISQADLVGRQGRDGYPVLPGQLFEDGIKMAQVTGGNGFRQVRSASSMVVKVIGLPHRRQDADAMAARVEKLLDLSTRTGPDTYCTQYYIMQREDPYLFVALDAFSPQQTTLRSFTSQCEDPITKQTLALQILKGLQSLHSAGLVHGGVSPDSVILPDASSSLVKLDHVPCFGGVQVRLTSPRAASTVRPTASIWDSPEVLYAIDSSPSSVERAPNDVFAAGCLIYYLLTKRHPFEEEGRDDSATIANLKAFKRSPSLLDPNGTEEHLLQRLLCAEDKRWSAVDASRHPYFWHENHLLEFIQAACNALSQNDAAKLFRHALAQVARDVTGQQPWVRKVDSNVLKLVPPDGNNTDSIQSLLCYLAACPGRVMALSEANQNRLRSALAEVLPRQQQVSPFAPATISSSDQSTLTLSQDLLRYMVLVCFPRLVLTLYDALASGQHPNWRDLGKMHAGAQLASFFVPEGNPLDGSHPPSRSQSAHKPLPVSLADLRQTLICPYMSNDSTHLLEDPVSLPCCGVGVCRSCITSYLQPNGGNCRCGHHYAGSRMVALQDAPTQAVLARVVELLSLKEDLS